MSKLNLNLIELHTAVAYALKKRKEYFEAIKIARTKAEQLSEDCQKVINQPHIEILDFEIDN